MSVIDHYERMLFFTRLRPAIAFALSRIPEAAELSGAKSQALPKLTRKIVLVFKATLAGDVPDGIRAF